MRRLSHHRRWGFALRCRGHRLPAEHGQAFRIEYRLLLSPNRRRLQHGPGGGDEVRGDHQAQAPHPLSHEARLPIRHAPGYEGVLHRGDASKAKRPH